jgi:hypothetical protein
MSQDPQYSAMPPAQGHPQSYPQGYPAPPTNTMAILSLIFAFVFWPLAIVFGHIARKQIARTGEGGQGLATAGLVLGYVFLAATVLGTIAVVALFAQTLSNDPYAAAQWLVAPVSAGPR